jgi:intracellular sulfur oxidation DsrE/DsrF family protein
MKRIGIPAILAVALMALVSASALCGDYDSALKGVEKFDVVFDYTNGDPVIGNIILEAMDTVDDAAEVKSLPNAPQKAIVIHDAAVNLINTVRGDRDDATWAEIQKFQNNLKKMKEKGTKIEVCEYALDVFKVDRSTVIPEIDQVPNGFVSVVGYQEQGYALIRIP